MSDFRPLLLCYDGSPRAERAITAAAELSPGRRAIVLTVWQPVGQYSLFNPLGAYVEALSPAARELDEIAARWATEQAEQGSNAARSAGLEAEPLAVSGERVATRVIEVAADRDAVAVVVGSHGHSRLGAALLGSVSSALTHECPLPVLVVPDRARR